MELHGRPRVNRLTGRLSTHGITGPVLGRAAAAPGLRPDEIVRGTRDALGGGLPCTPLVPSRGRGKTGRGGQGGIRANFSGFGALEGPAEGARSRLRATETGPRMPFTIVPSAPGGVVFADQSHSPRPAGAGPRVSLGWPLQRHPNTPPDTCISAYGGQGRGNGGRQRAEETARLGAGPIAVAYAVAVLPFSPAPDRPAGGTGYGPGEGAPWRAPTTPLPSHAHTRGS